MWNTLSTIQWTDAYKGGQTSARLTRQPVGQGLLEVLFHHRPIETEVVQTVLDSLVFHGADYHSLNHTFIVVFKVGEQQTQFLRPAIAENSRYRNDVPALQSCCFIT